MDKTDRRAKPAVYFGGKTRIVDFGAFERLQFGHPAHCRRHPVQGAQPHPASPSRVEFHAPDPATKVSTFSLPASAYRKTSGISARRTRSTRTSTLSRDMPPNNGRAGGRPRLQNGLRAHAATACGAESSSTTVGCIEVPRAEASGFGVMDVDEQDAIRSFIEKPAISSRHARQARYSACEHGYLCFPDENFCAISCGAMPPTTIQPTTSVAFYSSNCGSTAGVVLAHSFQRSCVRRNFGKRGAIWRDVGTVDAYWEANIDFIGRRPGPQHSAILIGRSGRITR